ncbi:MAG: HAMP domain-containing protein, partial [Pseudonocardiaceae bacterium]
MRILRRPLTLRGRLIAAVLALSAVGLAVFAGTSVMLLQHSLISRVDQRFPHFTEQLARGRIPLRLPSEIQEFTLGPRGIEQIGPQLGSSGGPVLNLGAVRRHAGHHPFTVADQAGGSPWRVRAVALPNHRVGVVAISLASLDATRRLLLIIEAIVGGIVLALIGIVATVVVALGLRPLTRIEQTAQAIAGGELDRRVAERDPRTETGRLGAALNV